MHSALYSEISNTIGLHSIRQQHRDCGLFCANNYNIYLLIAQDLDKCSDTKTVQKVYDNATKNVLPYRDSFSVVEKTAHFLFQQAYVFAYDKLRSTTNIDIPSLSDIREVKVEKTIFQKWANLEELVGKKYIENQK